MSLLLLATLSVLLTELELSTCWPQRDRQAPCDQCGKPHVADEIGHIEGSAGGTFALCRDDRVRLVERSREIIAAVEAANRRAFDFEMNGGGRTAGRCSGD